MKWHGGLLAAFLLACGSAQGFHDPDAGGDAALLTGDASVLGDAGPVCDHWVIEGYQAGTDGILGTGDDVVDGARTVQTVGPNNVLQRETSYSGKVVVRESRVVSISATEYDYMTFDGPGADTVWGTGDDHAAARLWVHLDGAGHIDETRAYQAGPDEVLRTPDDVVERRFTYTYADGTTKPTLSEWQYTAPGADLAWGTSDDGLGIVTSRFTGWGMFSTAPGVDATYGTKDDAVTSTYTDERNVKGRFQILKSLSAGPDGKHFTADDVVTSLAETACVAGVYDARIHMAPGPDGTWDTPDDVIQGRLRITACGQCGVLPQSPADPK